MEATPGITGTTTRRTVVAAAGAAGLAAALAACGNSGSTGGSASTAPASGGGAQASGTQSSAPAGGGGSALAKTADIPEGSGKIFPDHKIVVTQPTANSFKAFSSICTHEGCPVNEIANGTINCPCHGSKFHVADGSVAHGPATRPLAPAKITVEGGSIKLA